MVGAVEDVESADAVEAVLGLMVRLIQDYCVAQVRQGTQSRTYNPVAEQSSHMNATYEFIWVVLLHRQGQADEIQAKQSQHRQPTY